MSAELRDLYQEIILDHNKAPRNFRSIPDPDRRVEAFNPLITRST
jgi:nitrogen fixation NifU-like protein